MAVASRPKVVPVRSNTTAHSARPTPQQLPQRPLGHDRPLALINSVPPQYPNWLILLMALRKLSTPLLGALVVGVLPLYAWRVNTQQAWGNQYLELEQLQRDEQSWLTRNEERKYEISEDIERDPAGFMPKGSKTSVFLQPAPLRQPPPTPQPPADIKSIDLAPIAY